MLDWSPAFPFSSNRIALEEARDCNVGDPQVQRMARPQGHPRTKEAFSKIEA